MSLDKLVEKWRSRAAFNKEQSKASCVPEYREAIAETLSECADELESALASLRQVQEVEPVAWTIVGPDGKSSIGGWSDMSSHRVMSEIGILRDGHRYAYAYEANPAPPTTAECTRNCDCVGECKQPPTSGAEFHGIKIVEAPAQSDGTAIFRDDKGRVLGTITGIEATQTSGECSICPNDMLHEGPCNYEANSAPPTGGLATDKHCGRCGYFYKTACSCKATPAPAGAGLPEPCKHNWRNSDRHDPMMPNAWVQQCTKCGAYDDDE